MITVFIIGILLAIAVPQWIDERTRSQTGACIGNLKEIEMAKDEWAFQHNKGSTDSPNSTDLYGDPINGYMKSWPTCPASGTYTIGDMQTLPTCTVQDHVLT